MLWTWTGTWLSTCIVLMANKTHPARTPQGGSYTHLLQPPTNKSGGTCWPRLFASIPGASTTYGQCYAACIRHSTILVDSRGAVKIHGLLDARQPRVFNAHWVFCKPLWMRATSLPQSPCTRFLSLLCAPACEELGPLWRKNESKGPQQHPLLLPRSTLWQFLAWMERHDYHVMSTAVLEDLERVIEDAAHEGRSGERTSGVRQNRLEYLQRERDRLLRGGQTSSQRGGNRREVRPVTVPDDGCK
ncbi:putative heat shock protein-like protein [Trypanosoma conorhini]|uniref:Putative heat shock protein-like protein n=1 Tax=Trypanosoma conorhini TaxID=83891 RepID=A0A3S5IQH5_9TRYP|nr:putative heat shock protein-like protein [Trypanosoma conorhini]RNF00258.1 putative heat shock protein-like protein [Trypanosoma conorhini]